MALFCLTFFFTVIFTPVDEFNYWKNIQESLPTHDQKNRAEYFCRLLLPLEKSFKNTEIYTFSDFKENLDIAYNALDDLWKQDKYSPAFPSDRMEHLLDIIGKSIFSLVTMYVFFKEKKLLLLFI